MKQVSGPAVAPLEYYFEADHLRSGNLAVSASVSNASEMQYPELARTNSALYAQGYIYGGDYEGPSSSWERLTYTQPAETRLTIETFEELTELSHDATPDADSYLALGVYNAIHDSFKNRDMLSLVGLDKDDNHDSALERLFMPQYANVRREHFPSLESLNERQFTLIQGAAKANFIRFVQSQASEAEVEALATLPKDQLRFAIMHGIHDLAGAMSDEDETTSRSLDEPAATRLLDAAHALLEDVEMHGLPDNPHTRRWMYMYLRATRLGLIVPDMTHEDTVELPAKLAVADMLRCYSAKDFAIPHAAYNRLPFALRATWTQIQALPIQYPEKTDARFKGLGSEYGPAFLRAFGSDEDAVYTALGCYAQIQLHATALPLAAAGQHNNDWLNSETGQPYSKINLYHLAQRFRKAPPTFEKPIWLEYTISNGILTPQIAAPGRERTRHYDGHVMGLHHPRAFDVA